MKRKDLAAFSILHWGEIRSLLSKIRSRETEKDRFVFYFDRISRLLLEFALGGLPVREVKITTPVGAICLGSEFEGKLCVMEFSRTGQCMRAAVEQTCREVVIGKINVLSEKGSVWPDDIKKRRILMLAPVIATGKTLVAAINSMKRNVENFNLWNLIVVNLVASDPGINFIYENFPGLRLITAAIDDSLDERGEVVPGIGDLNSRYFWEK